MVNLGPEVEMRGGGGGVELEIFWPWPPCSWPPSLDGGGGVDLEVLGHHVPGHGHHAVLVLLKRLQSDLHKYSRG